MDYAAFILLSLGLLFSVFNIDKNLAKSLKIEVLIYIVSLFCFFLSGLITFFASLLILCALVFSFLSRNIANNFLIYFFTYLILLTSLGLALHIIPGFNNILILDNEVISNGSIPFTFYLNIDKGFSGVLTLLILPNILTDLRFCLKTKDTLFLVFSLAALFFIGYLGGFKFEPKLPEFIGYFIYGNIFLTCMAEEAFFRGVIQNTVLRFLDGIGNNQYLAIIFTSLLFGFAHYSGGLFVIVTAAIAGLLYGGIYHFTGKLSLTIAAHFGLNLMHILLFSYPKPY
jgi:membrane protease YdiL (CAAX protease family)